MDLKKQGAGRHGKTIQKRTIRKLYKIKGLAKKPDFFYKRTIGRICVYTPLSPL